jgi:hypothetical protein
MISINGSAVLTIRILSLVRNLLAEVLNARSGVSSSSLSVKCLAVVGAEPLGEGFPGRYNVVGNTFTGILS